MSPLTPPQLDPLAIGAPPGVDPGLRAITNKVHTGIRLSEADGMLLYETPDIWTVCSLADLVRRRLHGDIAYYNVNRHLNYSNICALSCKFCAFYRKKGEDGAYEYSLEQIADEARNAISGGATEIHIVGGLHPWLGFDYYTDMMRVIREAAPRLHIKAFTAVEIVHLARISKRGIGVRRPRNKQRGRWYNDPDLREPSRWYLLLPDLRVFRRHDRVLPDEHHG